MSETTKLTADRIISIRQRDVFCSSALGQAVPLSVSERDALCDAAERAETLEAQLTEVTRERDDAKLALSVVQNAAKTLVRGADERVLNATKHEPAARVAIATLDSELEMNAILTQQLEAAEAALAPLRAVVEAFLAKWEQVKPAIDGAFVMGHVHGARYTGPTIGEEIEAMRRALPADPSAPASGQAR